MSPGSFPPALIVGNLDARKQLFRFVENVRAAINDDEGSQTNGADLDGVETTTTATSLVIPFLPSGLEELSYLHYSLGAFIASTWMPFAPHRRP